MLLLLLKICILNYLFLTCAFSLNTTNSPSPWQEIHFNEWIGVAIVIPWGKVSGLQDVNYQVAKLLVIVDLKLQKETQLNYNRFGCILVLHLSNFSKNNIHLLRFYTLRIKSTQITDLQ